MKQVPKSDYREMVGLGLIDFSQSGRNIAVVNRQKKSRQKTYYVTDDVFLLYLHKKSSERNCVE